MSVFMRCDDEDEDRLEEMVEIEMNDMVIPDEENPELDLTESKKLRRSLLDPIGDKLFERLSSPDDLFARGNGDKSRIHLQDHAADKPEDVVTIFNKIVNLSLFQLREALQNDTTNAFTVLSAYVWRALKINKEFNCITQYLKEAFNTARELDDNASRVTQNGRKMDKKTLHGIPFSVKSNFNIQHRIVTLGIKEWTKNSAAEEDSKMVELLKSHGAIPFCLTNTPEGLLPYNTTNSLHGTTKNPWDLTRTPGGSSGGEAALLAAGGTPFGVGNDLIGGLRIPAAFCGLVTLKTGSQRMPTEGVKGGLAADAKLKLSAGFLTRTVAEQAFLLNLIDEEAQRVSHFSGRSIRAMCPTQMIDVNNGYQVQLKRKIGWFIDEDFSALFPSNRRAVEKVRELLRANGHHVIPFDIAEVNNSLCSSTYARDPSKMANMFLAKVKPRQEVYLKMINLMERRPHGCWAASGLIDRCLQGCQFGCHSNNDDTEQLERFTRNVRTAWNVEWARHEFQAVICPSFSTPAVPTEPAHQFNGGLVLTGLFNMLDIPAGIVPVGRVKKRDARRAHCARCTKPRDCRCTDASIRKNPNMIALGSAGLPNAVQVVTRKGDEAMCLEVMGIIEKLVNNRRDRALRAKRLRWKCPETVMGPHEIPSSALYFRKEYLHSTGDDADSAESNEEDVNPSSDSDTSRIDDGEEESTL